MNHAGQIAPFATDKRGQCRPVRLARSHLSQQGVNAEGEALGRHGRHRTNELEPANWVIFRRRDGWIDAMSDTQFRDAIKTLLVMGACDTQHANDAGLHAAQRQEAREKSAASWVDMVRGRSFAFTVSVLRQRPPAPIISGIVRSG
jgi:hypothetical protein